MIRPTAKPRKQVRMTTVLITIATVLGLWFVTGCAIQRSLIFPRFMMAPADPDELARPAHVERWTIPHDDGITEAWFMPGHGVTHDAPGAAVIFAHGNAELIDDNTGWLTGYTQRGISVLLVEYRGYGRSDGSPGQRVITDDFTAAYDMLIARGEVDAERIIFHGRSLGGGVVCDLATRRKPTALILQSPFTSTGAIAIRMLYPPFLLRDRFRNDRVLADFDHPVLLVHGSRDEVIPVSHSRKLHNIAPNSTFVEFDADHNNFPVGSQQFWQTIETFLQTHELVQPREHEPDLIRH